MSKDVLRLIGKAEEQGWFLKRRNRHYILFAPQGKGIVVLSKSPSDHRSYQNALSELRRLGLYL